VSSSGQQFDALSLNISESGIAILAQQVPRVGERLQLQFQLPEFGELSMAGDVCWTDGSGRAGIHFVQVARPTEAALQSWIEVQLHGLIPSD
jgi:Tfp pilus assembly protein PilZ